MEACINAALDKTQSSILPALHVAGLAEGVCAVIHATFILVVLRAPTDRAEEDRITEINPGDFKFPEKLRSNPAEPTATLACDFYPTEMRTEITHR
jgi:hypothetical protein